MRTFYMPKDLSALIKEVTGLFEVESDGEESPYNCAGLSSKNDYLVHTVPYKIKNEKDKYEVAIEVPGAEDKDIDIQLEKNKKLVVKVNFDTIVKKGEWAFEKTFENVDASKIESKLGKGILLITLPKKENEVVGIKITSE